MTKRLFLLLLVWSTIVLSGIAQTNEFRGANFSVQYPDDFLVAGSLPATNGYEEEGVLPLEFDSATFTSPYEEVQFYVFCPEKKREATDIKITRDEKESARVSKRRGKNTIVTHWTIGAKHGGYARSYQSFYNTQTGVYWIIGIKYNNTKAYNKYKKEYLAFKKSFVCYSMQD